MIAFSIKFCIRFWILVCLFPFGLCFSSFWNVPTTPIHKDQWKSIQKILSHPQIPISMKKELKNKIFIRHYHWATYCAWKFKRFHSHKTKHIHLNELAHYAHLGLWKSLQRYEGGLFHSYAYIYIRSELYDGLTKLYPLCKVSKVERKKKKRPLEQNITTYWQKKVYQKKITTQFTGENEWIFDKLPNLSKNSAVSISVEDKYHKMQRFREFWIRIQPLSPFQKRIFQLKYNFCFEKIRSNREVASLMACSEENVRKTLSSSFDLIRRQEDEGGGLENIISNNRIY